MLFHHETKQDKKHHEQKTSVAESLQAVYDELRSRDQKCATDLKAAQDRFEAISVGKFSSDDGGQAETLQAQIIKLKEELSHSQTAVKTNDMKIKHNDKEIKRLDAELKKTEHIYKKVSVRPKSLGGNFWELLATQITYIPRTRRT